MKLDRLVVAFETKALDDAGRTFEGYGSVFGVLDSYADIVAKGAFRRTLKESKAKGRMPALLWQHDPSKPIGVYEDMREDETGLIVKGRLSDTQLGREAYTLLKDGALSGLSIGFRTLKSKVDEENGVRTLTDIELWETSLVTFPANDAARVTGVKADGELPTEREFERSCGTQDSRAIKRRPLSQKAIDRCGGRPCHLKKPAEN
jgi:HK97 family phage prohead protease